MSASNKSYSTKRRDWMKIYDPEMYQTYLKQQREGYYKRKQKRDEFWASGTRQAIEHKEAFKEHKREMGRRSLEKKSSSCVPPPKKRNMKRSVMTDEERRQHDASLRKTNKLSKSWQKRAAEKKKAADYMRLYRQQKKMETTLPDPSTGTTVPSLHTDPLAASTLKGQLEDPSAGTTVPSLDTDPLAASTLKGQNDEIVAMREEISRLKQRNSYLSEKLEALEKVDDTRKAELVPSSNNKLVRGLQSELKRFQTTFTKEMDRMKMNTGKVEDTCDRLIRLQEMLNTLHMTVQQRKNLEDVVKDVMSRYSGNDDCICCHCRAQTQSGQAAQASGPSRTSDVIEAAKTLVEESNFDVSKTRVGLSGTLVGICGFDKIETESKYMNATTGVYTCPATGKFRFMVYAKKKSHYQLYLCSDRGEKRQELTRAMSKAGSLWFTVFDWECDKNELIWLEGKAKSYTSVDIEFDGCLMI